MKSLKLAYETAKIDVISFSAEDIVTASSADGFDYVDQDAWDA